RAWIELAARSAANPAVPREGIFKLGEACLTCHPGARAERPEWRAASALGAGRGFTRYSHRPHLELRDCGGCHGVAAPGGNAPIRGFLPLDRAVCLECHTPERAGDRCLTCHAYHVDAEAVRPAGREVR
ncbi:MAG: hypothetical protein HZA54_04590, partial [Planctomycetes bacterium]|nr:hypothetical protein [Planctomycetota bacterium]